MKKVESMLCVLGGGLLCVPIEFVARILDCKSLPAPPLSDVWVGGIAQSGDLLVLSLLLSSAKERDRTTERNTKGILLKSPEHKFNLLVEIERVVRICAVDVSRELFEFPDWCGRSAWVLKARGPDGPAGYLDADSVFRHLSRANG